MRMMFATPCEDFKSNDVLVRAMDRIFILHADQSRMRRRRRCGVRVVRHQSLRRHSGRRRMPVGPAHGGANEACLNMLYDIQRQGGVAKIGEFIPRSRTKNSNVKLMGFGHRVYKNYDPRAKLMRETCHEVLTELGLHDDPLFKLAMSLEKIALEDEYFVSQALPERRLLFRHRAEAIGSRCRCSRPSSRWRARLAGSRS